MKKWIFVCIIAPLLFACKKDSDNNTPTGNAMTAKVDGAAWSASLAVQGNKSAGTPVVLTLAGTGSGSQINLSVVNYNGPGTYSVSNGLTAVYTNTSTLEVYTATQGLGSGSLVVSSESNGLVQGTFSFTAASTGGGASKNITEGSYRIQL